ncbi:MAG: putative SAM-dependent methyltransferase [Planctomycetota bacterium]|jgi:predicted SAM-dependent methyltransferase
MSQAQFTSTPQGTQPAGSTLSSDTLTVLHVGCGSRNATELHDAFKGENWEEVRLDIDPAVEPDIVASITDMSPVASGTVDAIFCSHNLEHLEAHEVPLALAEFHRVLASGGMLLVTMPDLQAVAKVIAEGKLEETVYVSPAGPVAAIDIVYGYRPYISGGANRMGHRTGFTQGSLKKHLAAAGFTDGQVWSQEFDLWAMMTRS